MKLHLGCGKVRIPGYVNVDIQPGPAVDEVWDIRALPVTDGSVDLIYACSVLEHFGRAEWMDVLRHWHAKLRPGGILRVSVPDFRQCVAYYISTENIQILLGLLIGGQKDEHDWHGMIFDTPTLWRGLYRAGFSLVRRYDWRATDVGVLGIDDYSQAYLPHMDKEHGRLMMLNVEAVK